MTPRAAIKELLSTKESVILPMDRIEEWLKTHSLLITELLKKKLERTWESEADLPSDIGFISSQKIFQNLYSELKEILRYKKNENILKQKVDQYQSLVKGSEDSEKWVKENITYFTHNYSSFCIDYLDYEDNPKYVSVFLHTMPEVDVFIDQNEFKYFLDFEKIIHKMNS